MIIKSVPYLFIFIVFHSIFATWSQEFPSKDQITSWLEHYLNKDQNFFYQDYFARNSTLKEEGVDPIPFSMGLLSDVQYADFWEDAINLYTAAMYRSRNLPGLADHLIEWLERNEAVYTKDIIKFKGHCINILLQLVGPNFFQDSILKDKIITFADRFFRQGDVTKPDYWNTLYGLDNISFSQDHPISDDIRKSRVYAQSIARLCVQFAGHLYCATTNNNYLNIVEISKDSSDTQIASTAKYVLSEESKSNWYSGNYELFAMYRQRQTLTPEQIEAIQVNNPPGSTRTNKNENQAKN
ncbi:MAG: hypothetical protein C4527_22730 [Candidatus Omnitrophota bacterium]|jgi:hypothetical protein|nr:MAG: hypothetical protein C4527_22730 [Candidatus Omnitrophota bacterium]